MQQQQLSNKSIKMLNLLSIASERERKKKRKQKEGELVATARRMEFLLLLFMPLQAGIRTRLLLSKLLESFALELSEHLMVCLLLFAML
jgi:hypothetical protein